MTRRRILIAAALGLAVPAGAVWTASRQPVEAFEEPDPDDPPPGGTPPGRVINVSNTVQFWSALNNAIAGDTIVLANGNYLATALNGRAGTVDRPITIKAANPRGAVITGGTLEVEKSSYVVFSSLKWTTDKMVKITSSHHIRLTRNHFRLTEPGTLTWVLIQGAGSSRNRIDRNLFEQKHELGNCIAINGSDTRQSQYDVIDRNHFRNIGPRAPENGMETIRVGWSGVSESSGFTKIEHNLFERCDGDPEIISVKSDDNDIRYNTFRSSQGGVCSRRGDRNSFYGNFFLGGGKSGTGGIRVYGKDHNIYNNYFNGLTGTGFSAPLQLDGGDVDSSGPLTAHWRVYRAQVANNTFVDNVGHIEIGRNYDLPPVDCLLVSNLVVGSSGKLFAEFNSPVRLVYSDNIGWPMGSATLGVSVPASAIRVVNPLLVGGGGVFRLGAGSPAIHTGPGDFSAIQDDVDGQKRTDKRDVGADERSSAPIIRRPLTAADVGLNAP